MSKHSECVAPLLHWQAQQWHPPAMAAMSVWHHFSTDRLNNDTHQQWRPWVCGTTSPLTGSTMTPTSNGGHECEAPLLHWQAQQWHPLVMAAMSVRHHFSTDRLNNDTYQQWRPCVCGTTSLLTGSTMTPTSDGGHECEAPLLHWQVQQWHPPAMAAMSVWHHFSTDRLNNDTHQQWRPWVCGTTSPLTGSTMTPTSNGGHECEAPLLHWQAQQWHPLVMAAMSVRHHFSTDRLNNDTHQQWRPWVCGTTSPLTGSTMIPTSDGGHECEAPLLHWQAQQWHPPAMAAMSVWHHFSTDRLNNDTH